jgi:hypothetical protein
MAKKKDDKKKKKMGMPAKVKVRPSAKRVADRKDAVKAPSARVRKGTARSGARRSRGTGK